MYLHCIFSQMIVAKIKYSQYLNKVSEEFPTKRPPPPVIILVVKLIYSLKKNKNKKSVATNNSQ